MKTEITTGCNFKVKSFFSDETDRIPSHVLTRTFMSHSVLVYLFVFVCSCYEPVLVKSNNRSEYAKKHLFLSML